MGVAIRWWMGNPWWFDGSSLLHSILNLYRLLLFLCLGLFVLLREPRNGSCALCQIYTLGQRSSLDSYCPCHRSDFDHFRMFVHPAAHFATDTLPLAIYPNLWRWNLLYKVQLVGLHHTWRTQYRMHFWACLLLCRLRRMLRCDLWLCVLWSALHLVYCRHRRMSLSPDRVVGRRMVIHRGYRSMSIAWMRHIVLL